MSRNFFTFTKVVPHPIQFYLLIPHSLIAIQYLYVFELVAFYQAIF